MKCVVRRATFAIVTGLLAFGWLPGAVAISNETFGVTPSPERVDSVDRTGFTIPLETGATFEDAVRIYNRTDQTVTLVVYAADAEDTNGTIGVQSFRGTEPKGVGSWIDLSREDVELAPRKDAVVSFRVNVESTNPSPNYGAIVVENTSNSGLSSRSVDRLHLVVRTVPPNTPTTSRRVRTLLLRSPWIVIAMIGLLVVGILIWVGARRSRRPGDVVVPAGELEPLDETQDASIPVITRLGVQGDDDLTRAARPTRSRASRRRDERPLIDDALLVEVDPHDVDGPEPVYSLDDDEELAALSDDIDDEDDLPPARHRPAKRKPRQAPKAKPAAKRKPAAAKKKPAARKSTAKKTTARKPAPKTKGKPKGKGHYIPLEDL